MQTENIFTDFGSEEGRFSVMVESMYSESAPALRELEHRALEADIPIIRPATQGLIKFMLQLMQPHRILEVGSAVGFSALLMDYYAPEGCEIVTVERDALRAQEARNNIAAFGAGDRITLLEGDAAEILPAMEEPFDLIFMDAAKGQYIYFLPEVKRLLAEGGVLISDNILKGGEILSSKFAVARRDRTIHKRMREYLKAIAQDPDLKTVFLEAGDGTSLTVKRTQVKSQ